MAAADAQPIRLADLNADLIGEIAFWAGGSMGALRTCLRYDIRTVACKRIQRLVVAAIRAWDRRTPAVGDRVYVKKFGYGTVEGSTGYEDDLASIEWKVSLVNRTQSVYVRSDRLKFVEAWSDGPWHNATGHLSAKNAASTARSAATNAVKAARAVVRMAQENTSSDTAAHSTLALAAARTACIAAATATAAEMAADAGADNADSSAMHALTGIDDTVPAAVQEMQELQAAVQEVQTTVGQPLACRDGGATTEAFHGTPPPARAHPSPCFGALFGLY